MLKSQHRSSTASTERIDELKAGTVVLWEVLDRVVQDADRDDARVRSHLLRLLTEVEQHLAMVFHRFLARPKRRLGILVNGNELKAWDPFLESHAATQPTPEEAIPLPNHEEPIRVRGYVLPHHDKLGTDAHQAASGPAGWNAQQGFYLYRNDRLIVPGSWLGLGGTRPWTKEEHYKLARIRLSIPNSMDHLWHLDVKKSNATPPPLVRERLVGLAKKVRQDARAVFAHRGRYGPRQKKEEYARPWKSRRRGGRVVYQIDRKHPLVESVFSEVGKESAATVEAMLRVVEETVPVQQIWLDEADRKGEVAGPFHGVTAKQRRGVVETAYEAIRRNLCLTHEETVEVLRKCEEFADEEALAILATIGGRSKQ